MKGLRSEAAELSDNVASEIIERERREVGICD